ncbi:hypothetical protein [Haloferula sp.]|uniref:hypothetical protein n=1 Tax=Haloferula sp. TaxID=2497595 RepID=UPI00329B0465
MKHSISEEDLEFKRQVESCEFPISDFSHRAHLRLAYVYLSEGDTDTSVEQMRESLSRLIQHHGVPSSKFHETLTKAWILAVHHFMNNTVSSDSADELIDQHPEMLDTKIMLTHYSAETLFSEMAREEFVQPDLDPIPRHK